MALGSLLSGGSTSFKIPGPLIPAFGALSGEAQRVAGLPIPTRAVAGLSPYEQQALGGLSETARGAYLGPNPYLDDYFQAASRGITDAYEGAMSRIPAEYTLGGATPWHTGATEEFARRGFGLSESLRNLAGSIYLPAYQFERGQQEAATRGLMGAGGVARGVSQAQADLPYTQFLTEMGRLGPLSSAYSTLAGTPFEARTDMGLGQFLLGAGQIGASFFNPLSGGGGYAGAAGLPNYPYSNPYAMYGYT